MFFRGFQRFQTVENHERTYIAFDVFLELGFHSDCIPPKRECVFWPGENK